MICTKAREPREKIYFWMGRVGIDKEKSELETPKLTIHQ